MYPTLINRKISTVGSRKIGYRPFSITKGDTFCAAFLLHYNVMHQVFIIPGGDSFVTREKYLSFLKEFTVDNIDTFSDDKKGWKDTLIASLGTSYEGFRMRMPNRDNASYEEWSVWFEKLIPFLKDEVIFVGHSLGGAFLAKYLSQHTLPVTCNGLFLVSAPFNTDTDDALGSFVVTPPLDTLSRQCNHIFLYHSTDDPIVPFDELKKYQKELPAATARIFENRNHFLQEIFPELMEDIQSITT